MSNTQFYDQGVIANAHSKTRATFIRKTYLNLAIAILAFVGISFLFFITGISNLIISLYVSFSLAPLLILVAFMAAGWIAQSWASNSESIIMQYFGLLFYVVAEAVIFVPILYMAIIYSDPSVLPTAAFLTLFLFAALTFVAFINQTDFSFLRNFLVIGGLIAMGMIIASFIFGFSLGLWFSGIMVLFAGVAILYDTSNIMFKFREHQHVGAALSLFASVALLFFYILRFLLRFTSRN